MAERVYTKNYTGTEGVDLAGGESYSHRILGYGSGLKRVRTTTTGPHLATVNSLFTLIRSVYKKRTKFLKARVRNVQ